MDEPIASFRLLQWSTDNAGRGVALVNGRRYTHEEVCRLRDELAEVAKIGAAPGVAEALPAEPDEDEQWAIDRGADLLEHYAQYIHRVKPEDIEAHPYLPELEAVAEHLRALSRRRLADGVDSVDGSRKP